MNFSANKGRILENVVFIELKRRNKEVYYYSNEKECDFVIKMGTKINYAIQVCYNLNKSNEEREINALVEVMDKFKLRESWILTKEQEEEIKLKGKKIKVLPVWKWLLKA